jgi:hypothetical protein
MCNAKDGERVLHAPPQSVNASTTTAFKMPMLKGTPPDLVPWLDFTMNQQLLFRGEHSLGDGAESIVWGMDISPLQDLVAVSVWHQPSAVPTYIIPAEEESKIVILAPENGIADFSLATELELDSTERMRL